MNKSKCGIGALVLGVCAALLAAGCKSTAAADSRFIATIEVGEDQDRSVQVPPKASAGDAFEVTIVTYVGRGCEESAGVEVVVQGLSARVTPFTRQNGLNCPGQYATATVTAPVRFSTAGDAVVLIRGMSDITNDTIEVVRTVHVQ